MKVLKLTNVGYNYSDSKEKVFTELNAEFSTGKFYAIIGKSGAGKSTLLSLLAGLDTPTSGSVMFAGEDIIEKGYNYHRKKHITLVFQNYNLIDYLSPLENIRLVNKNAKKDNYSDIFM